MDKNSWKCQSRTGGNRRKLLKEYHNIVNYRVPVEDANLSQENVCRSNTASGQAGVFRGNMDQGSVSNDCNTTNVVNLEEGACSMSSDQAGLFRGTVDQGSVTDYCDTANLVNLEEGPCSISSDQAGVYRENVDHNSMNDDCDTTNLVSLEEGTCPMSSDDEDEPSELLKNLNFHNKLRVWAIEKKISHTALKDLLSILNERFNKILPTDARTLLQTPKDILIKTLENGGEYWHNGISGPLRSILEKLRDVPDIIHLNFNFDGLPLHNSSKKEFWPILANIYEVDADPFTIGVYFGVGKPKNLVAYLEDFVTDTKRILQDGLQIEHKKVSVKIRCFICDSPARAFIKGVCSFNGIHGCLKCTTVGEYCHRSHTVAFSSRKFPNRNNEDFRAKKYGRHHKVDSPLLELAIDMVQDFPVGDSLHLIDLGIMKRLLVGWLNGNFGIYTTKWCARDIDKVNDYLTKCRMPSEIHRAVRTLDCIAFWKGTEFRTFLHYVSVVALIDVLHVNVYQHFVTFFCAITICSVNKYSAFLPIARELLQNFVEKFKDFYGADYRTSNVHNLMHVVDEVEKFGPLPTFNTYPFENKLYTIKYMLRQGNKPLSQLANRLTEEMKVESFNVNRRSEFSGPIVTQRQSRTILNYSNFILSSKPKDRYCMTNDHDIVEIIEIKPIHESEVINIQGYKMRNKRDIFLLPIKSSYLNMFKVEDDVDNRDEILISSTDVLCKLVCMKYRDSLYFFPLLHTL